MPLLWLVLAGAWILYDRRAGPPGPGAGSWPGIVHLSALLGLLAGYDAFLPLREDGSLRLILLHPVRTSTVALAFFTGGGVVCVAFVLSLALYVMAGGAPRPPVGPAGAGAMALLTGLGFAACAQLGSLALGRDAAAVAGLAVVLLGSASPDAYLPADAPGWAARLLEAGLVLLPASHRMVEALAGRAFGHVALLTGQTAAALVLTAVLLRRRAAREERG